MRNVCLLALTVTLSWGCIESGGGDTTKLLPSADPIADSYIVVLKDGGTSAADTRAAAQRMAGAHGGTLGHVFEHAIHGFSVQLSADEAAALSTRDEVLYVEEDAAVTMTGDQLSPIWSLDRIDQRALPMDGLYHYDRTGAGVSAYVIDTGIRPTHVEFQGRASADFDAVGDGQNGIDCNGHGTHVAGTIGSATYGVAKGVSVHGVRVLDCAGQGQVSNLIAGIDWVTANHAGPSVANISMIVAGTSQSLEDAINRSMASGVTYTVASGNNAYDACSSEPGRIPGVLTVAASFSDTTDYAALYSNHGSCVDLYAPGQDIVSLSNADDVSTRMLSGTSMAAPAVAGAVAMFLEGQPWASPATVAQRVVQDATVGTLTQVPADTVNLLLHANVPPMSPAVTCSGPIYSRLAGAGDPAVYFPSAAGITAAGGTFRGTLTTYDGAAFVLALELKKGKQWTTAATTSTTMSFAGKSGTYRWRVTPTSGRGTYAACTVTP